MNIELFGVVYDIEYKHPECRVNGLSYWGKESRLQKDHPYLWHKFTQSGYQDVHRYLLHQAWNAWVKIQGQTPAETFDREHFHFLLQKGSLFIRYQSSFYTCDIGLPNPTLHNVNPNFYVLKVHSENNVIPIWDRYHCYALSPFFSHLSRWYDMVGRHWHPQAYHHIAMSYMRQPWSESYAELLRHVLSDEPVVSVYVLKKAMHCVEQCMEQGIKVHDLER